MWLMTKMGFFSIVKKGDMFGKADTWCIRSRAKKDLENLKKFTALEGEIIETLEDSDYHYRVFISGRELNNLFRVLPSSIEYPNFKQMIHANKDQQEKYPFYKECWHVLWTYQTIKERLERKVPDFLKIKKEKRGWS